MVDTRLPFGARRSPEIFHRLTQAVCRIMKHQGHSPVLALLDDFLVVADDKHSCQSTLQALLNLLRYLGFAINYSKLVNPTQRLTFLGIVLDTIKGTLELPTAKLNDLISQLSKLLGKSQCTKRNLRAQRISWRGLRKLSMADASTSAVCMIAYNNSKPLITTLASQLT